MSYKIVNKKNGRTIKSNCDLKYAYAFVQSSEELRVDLRIVPTNYEKIFVNGVWVWGRTGKKE